MSAKTIKEEGSHAAPEGERKDVLLDHNYDGIQEYDNPLPGWWSALFWLAIIVSPFYAVYFHGAKGRLVADEYQSDVAAVSKVRAEEALKNPVDDEGLRTLAKDQASMAGAATVFQTKCAQCHAAQGQGQIGPNLTDNYWIHGGKPIAIYKTINEGGRPGTGMKAWGKELDPTTVRQLAAYVTTLAGTNPPNAKAPEGELEE